jgi:membrane-anchored protein YejM (alkaline phosphatase superfamily)
VLITVDALRADQPWTGYEGVATPNLSRLARESVVYTRAYAVANLTTASINGMLASRYPSELRRDMCTIGRFEIQGSLVPTLKTASIQTSAAQGHAIFAGATAPSLGFDRWRLIAGAAGRLQKSGAVTGDDIADLVLAELDQPDPKQATFVWSHFVDPHHVYVVHSAYPATSSGDRARYDSEVAYTDALIGRILQKIEHDHMAKNTAVIVTSDHGEAFGEHGFKEHGFSLYEEEIRVPLMLRIPGIEAREIQVPRSAIDLAPTIVELFGVKAPASWRGTSLGRDLGVREPESRPVIVDVPAMQGRVAQSVVIEGMSKVVFTGRKVQAYDLAQDPGEKSPVSSTGAESAIARARQALSRIESVEATPCRQTAPPAAARDDP